MKTLGLIGGISWHSTAVYYSKINQLVNERMGGNHSARLILHSIDFDEFKQMQTNLDWPGVEKNGIRHSPAIRAGRRRLYHDLQQYPAPHCPGR